MLTLVGLYVLAIAIGAGCALINDLFFFLSLKHHKLAKHEVVTLKQLNNIQFFLIVWIILSEIVFFALSFQYTPNWTIAGVTVAKILIELTVLICALLLRQVYVPELIRHQQKYHHLSDSFVEHSNALVRTCAISFSSWFFIVLLTSSEFNAQAGDFGFTATIASFALTTLFVSWITLFLKNQVLHRKHRSK